MGVAEMEIVKGGRSMRKVKVDGQGRCRWEVEGSGGVWAYLRPGADFLPGFGNR